MNAAVVLERHQVGELFLADGAEEGARLVAVLVVEEGAGVAVSAATVLTHMALLFCARGVITLRICYAFWNMGQRWRNLLVHPIHPHGLTYS